MTIACKFGGTSLADAAQFRKVASIIQADANRRAVVVSAPGKRHKQDPTADGLQGWPIGCPSEAQVAGQVGTTIPAQSSSHFPSMQVGG